MHEQRSIQPKILELSKQGEMVLKKFLGKFPEKPKKLLNSPNSNHSKGKPKNFKGN